MELDAAAEVAKLKPTYEAVDKTPLLTDEMLDLALWLKDCANVVSFDADSAEIREYMHGNVRSRF